MTNIHSVGAAKVGGLIRAIREKQHISLKDLADRTGFDLSEIESIELGTQELSTESVIRIADALEISPGNLVADLRPSDFD